MRIVFLAVFVTLFFSSCAQKVTVKSIVPAKVGDKDIKNVTIKKFKNDDVLLQNNINSKMSEIKFEDKNYFQIVNREDTNKILKEQKLQDSGLVNNKGEEEYGLSDVSSIISGIVNSKTHTKRLYTSQRTDYTRCLQYKTTKNNKKYCAVYGTYLVNCEAHSYSVSANINITKVSNADIIFSKTFLDSSKQNICSDSASSLLPIQSVYENLSKNIANEFVSMISPTYRYISLVLIEDKDIDYSDTQEKMLENGLKLIELNDIQTANELLLQLVNSTKYQSSTALYNLGVTYEYLGKLQKALDVYEKAKRLTLLNDMDENIISSVSRIKKSIIDKNKANKQIQN